MANIGYDSLTDVTGTLLHNHVPDFPSGASWIAANTTNSLYMFSTLGGVVTAGENYQGMAEFSVAAASDNHAVSFGLKTWSAYNSAGEAFFIYGDAGVLCRLTHETNYGAERIYRGYAGIYRYKDNTFRIQRLDIDNTTTPGQPRPIITDLYSAAAASPMVQGSPARLFTVTVEGTNPVIVTIKEGDTVVATFSDSSADRVTTGKKSGMLIRAVNGNDPAIDTFSFDTYSPAGGGADTTAPTLSSASGSATGPTTATGSVTTNEGNGTLYWVTTTNATETAATVKAGSSKAVTATGAQSVTASALTAATNYRHHFLQRDEAGNDSAVLSTAQFTTGSASDTTPPTLSAASATKNGSTGATFSVTTNEANGALHYYFSTNATETVATVKSNGQFQAVTQTGVQTGSKTGLTAETLYYGHLVHTDAAGNDSAVIHTASFTTDAAGAAGTITWPFPIAPINGGPRKGEGHRIAVCNMTTDALIVRKTSLVSNSSTGVPPAISDALIVPGTKYRCHLILDNDNDASGTEVITAT